MINDITLNRDLHEKVMGKCWHEGFEWTKEGYVNCPKCKVVLYLKRGEYTTNPSDYWELLQKVKESDKWSGFIWLLGDDGRTKSAPCWMKFDILLDMPRGCQAIWEFFVNSEKP